MLDLLVAAVHVQQLCERRGWRFCFIGGVAVQRWGSPRFTVDLDLTLLAGYGSEEQVVEQLLADLPPRRPDAKSFAVRYRVLLARTKSGVPVDVALGALPFEERSVARASRWRLDDAGEIVTCSAEDLIVHKVFAGRDRDWDDVRGVLARQHRKLDWSLVHEELRPLLELKETPEALTRLERMAADVARQLGR